MQDFTLPVRRAILPALKGASAVTTLIPAGSIYPSTVPATRTFPFIRYGATIVSPFRATGLDTSQMTVKIDGFNKPVLVNGALTETAEDRCFRIGDAIGQTLDGRTLALATPYHARIVWTGSLCIPDPDEPDTWHASVSFRVEVAG